MKSIMLFSYILSLGLMARADVPNEVTQLMNKQGRFVSLMNNKKVQGEDGTQCQVIMNPYGGESSIVIESATEFTPVAHLDGATKSVLSDGTIVYSLNESGKRPGGSVCGDMTPLTSYHKTLEVKKNAVIIREKFRCLFEKTELVQACVVNL